MATRKPKTAEAPPAEAATRKPRRAPAAEAAAETPAAPKRARKSRAAAAPGAGLSHEERHRHIQEAAYYRAERRGFIPGSEHDDWLEAEAEIDARRKG